MAMKHSVYDTDTHFIINPVTRALTNEGSAKAMVIQHDHNSERVTFQLPRVVEGHDLSLCNVVQIHYNNIDAQTRQQNKGVYEVTDLQISPHNDNVIILSWLISHNVTKYAGSLSFLIRFSCVDDQENIEYAWNTAVCSDISISNGIYNGEAIAEEYADILERWYQKLSDANNNVRIEILNFSASQTTAEVGETVNSVTFSFGYNKTPISVTLNGETIPSACNSFVITGNFTTNQTWVLEATDERGTTATATTSLTFLHRIYYGLGKLESGFDEDFIHSGLALYTLSNSRSMAIRLKPTKSYAYYVVPKDLCETEPIFQIGEFSPAGGFEFIEEVNVRTVCDTPIVYRVYRSTELLDVDEPFKLCVW